jgi:nicotinamide-nucleotide amidase
MSDFSNSTHRVSARILSVGDELASGLTVDTNSAWFSRELAGEGVQVTEHATVADDLPTIVRAIQRMSDGCDLLVISGGIGPTPDDLTREALAEVVGGEVVIHDWWIERIREIWAKRGREMPEANRKQAGAPEGTYLLDNPVGTAAGVGATIDVCRVFVVPGVPKEARAMFDAHVRPAAAEMSARRGGRVLRTRALHTFGMGESDLAEHLGSLLERGHLGPDLEVGTTASRGVVSVRIYASGSSLAAATERLDQVEGRVRAELGSRVFGVDDETLPAAVAKCLRKHPKQPILSLAESCTGGLIAKLLTDLPGSSAFFHRGFVTYSNDSKIKLLNVPTETIARYGAVSEETAAAMAKGVRSVQGDGVSLSVTGIAGPGGGTEAKPVGTVCIGLAGPDDLLMTKRYQFHGDREMVRLRSAYMALAMLRLYLIGEDPATVGS